MLDPCSPCICSAPCGQCMFGFQNLEERQKSLIWLFENHLKNPECIGWGLVETFQLIHPNWKNLTEEYYKKNGGNVLC